VFHLCVVVHTLSTVATPGLGTLRRQKEVDGAKEDVYDSTASCACSSPNKPMWEARAAMNGAPFPVP